MNDRMNQAAVGLADTLGQREQQMMPRVATVTATNGSLVRVKFADEMSAGETWYPANVHGVPVGTRGVVHPLRGNAGYFVAEAIALPVPLYQQYGGVTMSSTSLTETTWMLEDTVRLTRGVWRVNLLWWIHMWRSVDSGTRRMVCHVDGINNTWTESQQRPVTQGVLMLRGNSASGGGTPPLVAVENTRDVAIKLGFLGIQTPGTTYGHLGGYRGEVTRIGDYA